MGKIKLKKNLREFVRQASKIVHQWNGHLEIFSPPEAIENSRQFLFLRTDIFTKQSLVVPD